MAPYWYELGVDLLETYAELNIIRKDHKGDATTSCIDMFLLWLERQPTASWNQLIKSLRQPSIGLETLANKIEYELLRTPELGMYICTYVSLHVTIIMPITQGSKVIFY